MLSTLFTFLDLPPEVRNMIYAELLATGDNVVHIHENERAADHMISKKKPVMAILRTCRSIYDEARHYLTYGSLVFRTDVRRAGYEATEQLPKLGQHLTGSLFLNISTISVGVTDLWRVVGSLGSLKTRMAKLKLIQAIVIKRMPYRYWKEKFPNILLSLTSSQGQERLVSRACRSSSDRKHLPELELAKFRCHVRFHPLMNKDEHYIDDDEDGYDQDRGNEVFARSAGMLTDRGLELHVCGWWILVDRKANNTVQLVANTTFDLATGQIFTVSLRGMPPQLDKLEVLRSTETLVHLERQALQELHSNSG